MLKGKTNAKAIFAAMLLTTTFLVASTEAQARRYYGHAGTSVSKYQINKSVKYRKYRYVRSKKFTYKASRYSSQRGKYVNRQASNRNTVPSYNENQFINQIDPDSPYAMQIMLQQGRTVTNNSAYSERQASSWGWRNTGVMQNAESMVGLTARGDRGELRRIFASTLRTAVDPARTPWCAAWANAVLAKSGLQGTGSLLARSFMNWGTSTHNPEKGDVAVLARGRNGISGHVGFVVERQTINGRRYVKLLGGNQGRQVKTAWFPESRVIGYRKAS